MPNRITRLSWATTLVLGLLGCSHQAPDTADIAAPPPAQETKTADDVGGPALIPREMLFGNPARFRGRLSPSGEQVSYLAPVDGVMNIWVGPAANLDAAKPITNDKSRGIQLYQWSASDDYIIYLRDAGGDENDHVVAVDAATEAAPIRVVGACSRLQPAQRTVGGRLVDARRRRHFDRELQFARFGEQGIAVVQSERAVVTGIGRAHGH